MSQTTEDKIKAGRAWFAEMWTSRLDFMLRRCESPIEQLFAIRIFGLPRVEWQHGYYGAEEDPFAGDGDVLFYCQYPVEVDRKRYRLDFAAIGNGHKVAIEVDGHEFHERTKAQAKRDKSRDRALTLAGWKVLRFTGSEVWAGADDCAWQVLRALYPENNEGP